MKTKSIYLLLLLILPMFGCTQRTQRPMVALSFDDGPNTTTTIRMLDVLKKHGVVASFFVIGDQINDSTALVMQRAAAEGHDIENHSRTHCAMPQLTPDSMRKEIEYTTELIKRYVGEEPQFFRPPYIAVSPEMFEAIPLPFICGESSTDWEPDVTAEMRAEHILSSARDGLIYLLHDFPGNEATVEAVDSIIPILKERGYEFVTVRELFRRKGIEPAKGIVYSDILNAEPWQAAQ